MYQTKLLFLLPSDPNDATVIAVSDGPLSFEERGEKSMAISLEGKKF